MVAIQVINMNESRLAHHEGRFQQQRKTAEGIAGQGMVQRGLLRRLAFQHVQALFFSHQQMHQHDHHQETRDRHQHQSVHPQPLHEQSGDDGPHDGAQRSRRPRSGRNSRVACPARIDVGHQGPEHRDQDQIDGAEPAEISRRHPAAMRREVKQQHRRSAD